MASFRLSKLAEMDVDSIGEYTLSRWGLKQAEIYLTELDAQFFKLARIPELGKNQRQIKPNLLSIRCNKHLIFFKRDAQNNIEILRILHQSMDFERHF